MDYEYLLLLIVYDERDLEVLYPYAMLLWERRFTLRRYPLPS